MHILVTGATGFIGKSLVPLLQQNGYSVRTTHRTIDKHDVQTRSILLENIYFDLDADNNDYDRLLDGIDIVIHLAGRAHIFDKNNNDLQIYRKINTQGTDRLVKIASKSGVKRFIYLSSIKVNGEKNEPYAFNEGDKPNPQDAYAMSKLEAENVIRKICHESDMVFVILRPALVYGPGVRANFLSLINIINQNYPLPLATVKNRRSLLYVKNLAHAISACINCPEIANQTYLISDTDISVPELIRKIASMLGKKALLFPIPVGLLKLIGSLLGKRSMIDRLTSSLLVNNSRLIQDLQWTLPYSFDEGLKATIDWYQHRQNT